MRTIIKGLIGLALVCSLQLSVRADDAGSLVGGTKQQVLDLYGAPTNQMKTGTKEFLVYPRGRVVVENGRVAQSTLPLPIPVETKRWPVASPTLVTVQQVSPPPPARIPRPAPAVVVEPAPLWANGAFIQVALPWLVLTVLGALAILKVASSRPQRSARLRDQLLLPPSLPRMVAVGADNSARGHIAARLQEFHSKESAASLSGFSTAVLEAPEIHRTLTEELLADLEWRRFEILVTGYFNAAGIKATRSRVGADGGVDIFLHEAPGPKPTAVVQCKAWHVYQVGVKPVRELFGVMAAEGISTGYFVTTGRFTSEAREFARGKTFHLWSGDDLLEKVNALPSDRLSALLEEVTAGDYITPTCPSCDTKMVMRQSARPFWGCRSYPRCRSKLNFRS